MKTLLFALALVLLVAPGATAADGKGKVCGGFAGVPCPSGQYCDLRAGFCGGADIQGRCVTVPEVCTKDFRPVCGCDGRTYSNDCMRIMARARKDHDGPCR